MTKRVLSVATLLALGLGACGGEEGSRERGESLPEFNDREMAGAPGPGDSPAPPAGGMVPGYEMPGAGVPLGTPGNGQTPGGVPGGAPSVMSERLPRSTPEAEGVDSAGLLALINALDGSVGEVHSMMLVRHGKVVAEAFWAPYTADDIHVLYSVTKSFNATAVGFAADEGLLSIDDLLLSHFSDIAPAQPAGQMANMRVRDLLTMSTGHDMDTMSTLRARADGQWTRAFLETNVPRPPGTYFLYNSGAAYTLAALVQKVTGMTVEEYLRPRLFEPLGIGATLWGQSPERVNMGDGGLSVRTEDLAKFGQLYLQDGMWNGERVLPEGWAAAATSSQVSTGNSDSNWGYGYGFQFWRSAYGYRADGSLGQFAFVLPEQDVVLAITSGTNDTNGVMNVVWQNLLPALEASALPDNPAGLSALTDRSSGLSLRLPAGMPSSDMAGSVSGRRYTIGSNNQKITSMQLDFSGANPVLSIEDDAGVHTIQVGSGAWLRGRTDFKQRINDLFETPEQGIAASGAWLDADTFGVKLVFDETPYTINANFNFEAARMLVDMSYNVRWGNVTEPQLVGTP
jgi:CubicO group peptidase (beta-lactamase class C family)